MMLRDLNEASRRLLSIIQKGFPLEERPFSNLARQAELAEKDALNRIQDLKDRGFIVEISGIFNASALGYSTTLVAMKVPVERLDRAANIISLHPGVGHNYSRESLYNLWFTLSLPKEKNPEAEINKMQKKAGALSALLLPSLRLFKIGVFIEPGKQGQEAHMEGLDGGEAPGTRLEGGPFNGHISPEEINVVRGLQRDLILELKPFAFLAKSSGMGEKLFLEKAKGLLENKIMRRYAAQLPHRQLGFNFNAMICWKVPPERSIEVGKALASSPWVTHCYERPAYTDWPYNLYSMVHGKTREECEEKARNLSSQVHITEYVPLFSPKEYKKARVKYFVGEK